MSGLKKTDLLAVSGFWGYSWLLLRAAWTKAWTVFGALTTGAAFGAWWASRQHPEWAAALTDLAWQVPAAFSVLTLLIRWFLAPFEVHTQIVKQANKRIATLGDDLVDARETLKKAQDSLPAFVATVDLLSIWKVRDGACRVLAIVNVVNAGVPSLAEHWRLQIRVAGESIEVKKINPFRADVLEVPDLNGSVFIRGSEFINYKTHPGAVGSMHAERGVLMFDIPESLDRTWRLVVSFVDGRQHRYETTYQPSTRPTYTGGLASLGGWSGLEIYFSMPALSEGARLLRCQHENFGLS